jgi:hypothetical protein
MSCAYCGKQISRKEMKNETFVSIRQFRYGKNNEMKFIDEGISEVIHKKCFMPSYVEGHPCTRGLAE